MEAHQIDLLVRDLIHAGKVNSQAAFAESIGYSRAFLNQVLKGRKPPPQEMVEAISKLYDVHQTIGSGENATGRAVPFYDAPATAGSDETDMMPVSNPTGKINAGNVLGTCTAAIRIHGNSMLDGYPSGTILGLVEDTDRFIVPGSLYVLETKSQRLFKRLFLDFEDDSLLICFSDNKRNFEDGPLKGQPYYPPFKLHKQDLIRKFIVTGSAREHANTNIIYQS